MNVCAHGWTLQVVKLLSRLKLEITVKQDILPLSKDDFLPSRTVSSKSSRLLLLVLASNLSLKCFFFLISANREVSCRATSLLRDLSDRLGDRGDLDLDLWDLDNFLSLDILLGDLFLEGGEGVLPR